MPEEHAKGYERRDINGFWLLVALVSFAVCFAVTLIAVYWTLQADLVTRPEPPPVAQQAPPVPEPHLLVEPEAELREFMRDKLGRLHGYGWVDRNQQIAHIPIEQAMERIARDGIPRWQQQTPGTGQQAREAYRSVLPPVNRPEGESR